MYTVLLSVTEYTWQHTKKSSQGRLQNLLAMCCFKNLVTDCIVIIPHVFSRKQRFSFSAGSSLFSLFVVNMKGIFTKVRVAAAINHLLFLWYRQNALGSFFSEKMVSIRTFQSQDKLRKTNKKRKFRVASFLSFPSQK